MAIAIRISEAQTELELSIAVSNFGLEMLVEQLSGETDTNDSEEAVSATSGYGLTRSQRKAILTEFRRAVTGNAPVDGDYVRDLGKIESRLFWRTAKDKIGRMLRSYEIAFEQEELDQFIDVRNSISHGKPAEYGVPAKVKAMLFGQAMLTQSILAELGWTGATYDERQARLARPSHSTEAADG
jgi:hypothetical protein